MFHFNFVSPVETLSLFLEANVMGKIPVIVCYEGIEEIMESSEI